MDAARGTATSRRWPPRRSCAGGCSACRTCRWGSSAAWRTGRGRAGCSWTRSAAAWRGRRAWRFCDSRGRMGSGRGGNDGAAGGIVGVDADVRCGMRDVNVCHPERSVTQPKDLPAGGSGPRESTAGNASFDDPSTALHSAQDDSRCTPCPPTIAIASRWRPALHDADVHARRRTRQPLQAPPARHRSATGGWRYGRELPLAVVLERAARSASSRGCAPRSKPWATTGADAISRPADGSAAPCSRNASCRSIPAPQRRRRALAPRRAHAACWSRRWTIPRRDVPRPARFPGRALHAPPERRNYPACCQHCPQLPVCEAGDPAMTPALAWRKLGLIEPDGTPTRRGVIFRFSTTARVWRWPPRWNNRRRDYPIDDLVYDLANLRAGHRFTPEGENPHGGRLGGICARAYAARGSSRLSGNGRAAGLRRRRGAGRPGNGRALPATATGCSTTCCVAGDLERALTEWRSLLVHVAVRAGSSVGSLAGVPGGGAAARRHSAGAGELPGFPPLSAAQQRRYQHRLFLK